MDLPVPEPPSSPRAYRSSGWNLGAHRRRVLNTLRWGRFWVGLSFVLLLASYLGAIHFMPPLRVNRHILTSVCATAALWDALLLGAVWRRNNWARVIFIAVHVIAVIAFCAILPTLVMIRPQWPEMVVSKLGACALLHAVAACLLATLRSVGRLANRAYQ